METRNIWLARISWWAVVGVAGLLTTLGPACRAQEVNPDHFTATGIEGVNAKASAPVAELNKRSGTTKTRAVRLSAAGTHGTASAKHTEVVLVSKKTQAAGRKTEARKH